MHLQHAVNHYLRPFQHRFLSQWPLTIILLTLLWVLVLHWGERSTFRQHINECHWDRWESWPADAKPHRMVMVADPQIVDPHTYPGRPWPLSSLTEQYTDAYMARNYRLINAKLDPDTVVFLGDLIDGGREWATPQAKSLNQEQREKLEGMGITKDSKKAEDGLMKKNKRSMETYRAALTAPHSRPISRSEHNLAKDGTDLRAFVHGENGKWRKWGQSQWDKEFERFGRMFFAQDQLYPDTEPGLLEAFEVVNDPISVDNGATPSAWYEYATSRSKHRRLLTTLPGNHDVGFGSGVQLSVRDRFHSRFGESDRVDVIGNHTFVSLDTPSLSALSQFEREGGETKPEQMMARGHIWKPTHNFLGDIKEAVKKANTDALSEYYPTELESSGYHHEVTEPSDLDSQPHPSKLASDIQPELPIVLLTHIPLYRERNVDCGKWRERGNAIPIEAGYQYQTVLTNSLTKTIIKKVSVGGEIIQAFSGDDHDYCDMVHKYNIERSKPGDEKPKPTPSSIREITVKSFSWAMGVRKPGFQLVSLWNPVNEYGRSLGNPRTPTIQTQLCLLPDQLSIFITYLLLLSFTLLTLLLRATILALRALTISPPTFEDGYTMKPLLSRFGPRVETSLSNGSNTPSRSTSKTGSEPRNRASSATSSTPEKHNTSLGVQRSYNARTRSVSPAAAGSSPYNNTTTTLSPLADRGNKQLEVRWQDPDDSDEESRLGFKEGEEYTGYGEDEEGSGGGMDSQGKWKFRQYGVRRSGRGTAMRAVVEFWWSVLLVGVPGVGYYLWLVGRG